MNLYRLIWNGVGSVGGFSDADAGAIELHDVRAGVHEAWRAVGAGQQHRHVGRRVVRLTSVACSAQLRWETTRCLVVQRP